jgi:hypothetical protein
LVRPRFHPSNRSCSVHSIRNLGTIWLSYSSFSLFFIRWFQSNYYLPFCY